MPLCSSPGATSDEESCHRQNCRGIHGAGTRCPLLGAVYISTHRAHAKLINFVHVSTFSTLRERVYNLLIFPISTAVTRIHLTLSMQVVLGLECFTDNFLVRSLVLS